MSRLPFNSVGGFSVGATGQYTVIDTDANVSAAGGTFSASVNIQGNVDASTSQNILKIGKPGVGDVIRFYGGADGEGMQIIAENLDGSGGTSLTYRAVSHTIIGYGSEPLATFTPGNSNINTPLTIGGLGSIDVQSNLIFQQDAGLYLGMPNGQTADSLVAKLNGLSGSISITAGSNVTVSVTGNTITISSSGGTGSGTPGATGATGPTGATGSQGATGPTGPQGATGPVTIASYTATGAASFSSNDFIVTAAGAVSLTSGIVRSFNGLTGTVTYSPPLATLSITGVASFNATNFAVSATGNVSLLATSVTASVDFGSAVDRIGFSVTGLTSANHEYQFANNIGLTAYLRNASGSVVVSGIIESCQNYWNHSYTITGATYSFPTDGIGTLVTLTYTGGIPNYFRRDADIVMKGPFSQGATTYSASDLMNLSLVVFGDNNIYTRKLFSGISGDGGFYNNMVTGLTASRGITFNGSGSTFGLTGSNLRVLHKQESYAITTVTGQTWVTANHYIQCRTMGLSSADHDAEDAIIEGVRFEINNVVVGTGFDIIGHAPEGTYGKYMVKCIGQSV